MNNIIELKAASDKAYQKAVGSHKSAFLMPEGRIDSKEERDARAVYNNDRLAYQDAHSIYNAALKQDITIES